MWLLLLQKKWSGEEARRGEEDGNGGCGGRRHVDGGELISVEIYAPSPLIVDMPPRIKINACPHLCVMVGNAATATTIGGGSDFIRCGVVLRSC